MKVYCIFEEYQMNTLQCQYALVKVLSNKEDAVAFIQSKLNPSRWFYEEHELE